jgi:alanine racemase
MPSVETLTQSQHGTWIEIRLDRLKNNLQTLKRIAGPDAQVMAVVKANAYGHGLTEIAKAFFGEVRYLGVASVQEALDLRERFLEASIFMFGRPLAHELPALILGGITLSVSSLDEAEEISSLAVSLQKKATIHVKVDTGMGRLGIPFAQASRVIEKTAVLPDLSLEGIYTHFPTAECEDGFSERQLADFNFLIHALEKKGISFRFRHAANSAGILKIKNPLLNLVRPGLMLYGIYPDSSLVPLASVAPVLSLKSRIISLKRIKTGETVGYGRDFVASKSTTIGVLAIGYSHGYPFTASNKAQVIHRGKRHPIAGRVSMDYLAVDLGDASAKIGDEVTLIGEDHGEKITAEELALWAQTIPYEIVTRLLPSLPRLYR